MCLSKVGWGGQGGFVVNDQLAYEPDQLQHLWIAIAGFVRVFVHQV